MSEAPDNPQVNQRTVKRIAWRLLPFLFLLYIIAFLDRMNVGAAALQMPGDLGLDDRVIGLGAGMFFVGYVLLEIPGALIAELWSARRWIARIMISWGIITVLTALIQTARQFYIARFLVGAAEAGFFPAVIVYLTHWFRYGDRAKALAVFYAANPLSYVIGSPVAGLLLSISWLGMRGWRWLFILEVFRPSCLGRLRFSIDGSCPRQAGWLQEDERAWIAGQLEGEESEAASSARQKLASAWPARCNAAHALLFLRDHRRLRHRFLASNDSEASVRAKRPPCNPDRFVAIRSWFFGTTNECRHSDNLASVGGTRQSRCSPAE